MNRWKLTVEYDGTDFVGWSRQPGQRTVQGSIEACIQQIFQHEVTLAVSGRTDAGVHAFGQVAAFSSPKNKDADRIRIGLNGLLPDDIAIVSVEPVGIDFEPRFGRVQSVTDTLGLSVPHVVRYGGIRSGMSQNHLTWRKCIKPHKRFSVSMISAAFVRVGARLRMQYVG